MRILRGNKASTNRQRRLVHHTLTLISMSFHLLPLRRRRAGFSLIEISLSLAIMGFAFVGVLGLMSNGLSTFHRSIDATTSAQIADRVIHDAQQADFNALIDAKNITSAIPDPAYSFRAPSISAPAFRYFDVEGKEIVPQSTALSAEEQRRAVYQVNVRIRPFADLPRPALAKTPQLAQLTIQVIHLGGNALAEVETSDGPNQNLLKVHGQPIYTYATLVARNE